MRKGLGILLFGIIASANAFADDESLLLPNTTNQDACVADNTGVYETGFEMAFLCAQTFLKSPFDNVEKRICRLQKIS